MNKSQLISLIKSRIASLDSLISRIEKTLAGNVSEHLIISTMYGVARFYKTSDCGAGRKYIRDRSEISSLAQKRYYERLKNAAQKECRQMELCLTHLNKDVPNSDVEKVYESFPDSLKQFVRPDVITDDGFADAWQAKKVICGRKTSSHTIKTV